MEGHTNKSRSIANPSYIPKKSQPVLRGDLNRPNIKPIIQDYENILGPAELDGKLDPNSSKHHSCLQLPQVLQGPNVNLTYHINCLISYATNPPFTSLILPYKNI